MSTPADKVLKKINKKAFTEITGYYLDYNKPICKKIFKGWDNYPLDIHNQNVKFLESYDRNLRKQIIKNKTN